MRKVLCVCLGNTCRSPMMQALLQRELGDEFKVESAGLLEEAAGSPANMHSILMMRERGIDLTSHKSRFVGGLDLTEFSHFVCVGEKEAGQVRELLGEHAATVLVANESDGGVPNPYKKGLDAYRECVALLEKVMPEVARLVC